MDINPKKYNVWTKRADIIKNICVSVTRTINELCFGFNEVEIRNIVVGLNAVKDAGFGSEEIDDLIESLKTETMSKERYYRIDIEIINKIHKEFDGCLFEGEIAESLTDDVINTLNDFEECFKIVDEAFNVNRFNRFTAN